MPLGLGVERCRDDEDRLPEAASVLLRRMFGLRGGTGTGSSEGSTGKSLARPPNGMLFVRGMTMSSDGEADMTATYSPKSSVTRPLPFDEDGRFVDFMLSLDGRFQIRLLEEASLILVFRDEAGEVGERG